MLPQESNARSMHLTTPHLKTNAPRGAQVDESMFAIYTMWALGLKMATASVYWSATLHQA